MLRYCISDKQEEPQTKILTGDDRKEKDTDRPKKVQGKKSGKKIISVTNVESTGEGNQGYSTVKGIKVSCWKKGEDVSKMMQNVTFLKSVSHKNIG